jgi:hypothetical protein
MSTAFFSILDKSTLITHYFIEKMVQQFFYLSFITLVIYWSSTILGVLGYTNDPSEDRTTNNNINSLVFISMFICILLICLIIYYHSSIDLLKQENRSIETNLIRNINDLPNFKVIKPYIILFIHRRQAQFIFDELISEAKRTKIFTIVPKKISLHPNNMFIHIELIQDTQTIIALIEYSDVTDEHSNYSFTLRRFFVTVFQPSNTIQIWGNIIQELRPYIRYGLFSMYEVTSSQSVNIQKEFKLWYNRTFHHHTQCHRCLKYDHMDDSLCSCSHRPYKFSSNQWSIKKAIAYTFDELFNVHHHGIHQCLAITKLAHIISQNWTIQQLKDYKRNHHINQNVSN